MRAGVIEGFFGRPWDWPGRQSVIDFLGDSGYQFYIYAPKADLFLRRRWREPMPEETLAQLSALRACGADAGVSLGVGLTPFEIYLNYDAAARSSLREKVRQINETGAQMLCILFDDMRGDVDGLPSRQASVVADICAWSSARQFIVCPTYYSYDSRLTKEFGPPPKSYLRDLGQIIDSRVDIFWTGENVISQGYSAQHLQEVATDLRRKPFIWDNSISNDSRIRTQHLYLDPSAGGWEIPEGLVAGLAINPMNQAHLSKLALCRFRRLFAAQPAADKTDIIVDCAERLCGPMVAAQLREDTRLIQEIGIEGMAPEKRRGLLARYQSEAANPYAQDIAAWLRNEYAFDPQCLTA